MIKSEIIKKVPLRPDEYNHDDEGIRVFQSADQQSLIQSFHWIFVKKQHVESPKIGQVSP